MNPKIREDFPVLKKGIIYFDSACVSLKPRQVVEASNEYYEEYPACAGRSNHKLGNKVTEKVEESRNTISKFFNAKKPSEIIFTRNTTEGINLIANSFDLNGTVVTTDKEHNSNLLPWIRLKELGKIKHKVVDSLQDNTFNMEKFEQILGEGNVKLVAIHHTSNLDGISVPLKEITKLAHEYNAKVLVDAAQSAGHHELDVKKLDIDFLACSGHKMLGPSGIGCLYGKEEELKKLNPFMLGGETVKESWIDRYELEEIPHRFEAGLQNYSGIIGFAAAVKYVDKIGRNNIHNHEVKLNSKLTHVITGLPVQIIGNRNAEMRGGITSFYSKMDSHAISLILNQSNIMVRSGAFCVHSWFNKHKIKGAVRFSSYVYNTEEEVKVIDDFLNSRLLKMLK